MPGPTRLSHQPTLPSAWVPATWCPALSAWQTNTALLRFAGDCVGHRLGTQREGTGVARHVNRDAHVTSVASHASNRAGVSRPFSSSPTNIAGEHAQLPRSARCVRQAQPTSDGRSAASRLSDQWKEACAQSWNNAPEDSTRLAVAATASPGASLALASQLARPHTDGFAAFHDSHTRVGGSEVDSENFGHNLVSWLS